MNHHRLALIGIVLTLVGCAGAFPLHLHAETTPGELFPGATGQSPEPKTPPAARGDVSPSGSKPDTVGPPAPPKPETIGPPAPASAPARIVPAAAPVPAPEPPIQKVAPPNAKALADASKLVNEVYGTDLAAAKTADLKVALAKKLLDDGTAEKDPAGRWVIFTKARDLSLDAGDVEGALAAVEQLNTYFEIDALRMQADATIQAALDARTAEQRKALAAAARRRMDAAIVADRYDIARSMAELGLNTARTTNDADLIKDAAAAVQSLREVEAAYADAKKAAETLATKPDDLDANLKLGKYRCFYKGDWQAGLALLEIGSDKALAELAKLDLAQPASADDQVKVGDGWWDLSQNATSVAALQLQRRAVMYYATALPQVSGLAKAKLEKRIKEINANQAASGTGKTDGPDAIEQILARLPAELLPAKDDTQLDLETKTNKIRQWMNRNLIIERGTPATISVAGTYSNTSIYNMSRLGVGGGADRQQLSINFRNHSEFKGVPCTMSLQISRMINGTDDLDYKRAKALEKDAKNGLLTIDAKVTSISIYLGHYTVYDSGGMVVSGRNVPPSISISMTSTLGDWTIRPRVTADK